MTTNLTPPPSDRTPSRMEARLKERHAAGTEDYKRVFKCAPARWLQMEREYGTLRACQMILTENPSDPNGWATQLQPMWEKGRLCHSVEAVALEPEFAPLFTDAERAVARDRLTKLEYEVK